MAVTFSLGMWQLGRGAEKMALQAAKTEKSNQTLLDDRSLSESMDPVAQQGMMYRRIALKGQWLQDKTVYLDNRQMNGRPGFYVFTPLGPSCAGDTHRTS